MVGYTDLCLTSRHISKPNGLNGSGRDVIIYWPDLVRNQPMNVKAVSIAVRLKEIEKPK